MRFVLITLICFLSFEIQAITPSKKQSIMELIEVSMLSDCIGPMVYSRITKQNKDANEAEVVAKVKSRMDESFYSQAIPVMDEKFSEEEVQTLIAFYKSDLYKSLKDAMGQIFHDLMFVRFYNLVDEILEPYPEVLAKPEVEPNDQVVHLVEGKFEETVLRSTLPVVVDVYGKTCPPCKRLSPIISELSNEMKDTVKFVKIDNAMHKKLTEELKINVVPTLLFYKEGNLVATHKGFLDKEALIAKIETIR